MLVPAAASPGQVRTDMDAAIQEMNSMHVLAWVSFLKLRNVDDVAVVRIAPTHIHLRPVTADVVREGRHLISLDALYTAIHTSPRHATAMADACLCYNGLLYSDNELNLQSRSSLVWGTCLCPCATQTCCVCISVTSSIYIRT